jgi:diguanylate cyclase (GGDEF)-like protein/PAS domain S-box-containing protein
MMRIALLVITCLLFSLPVAAATDSPNGKVLRVVAANTVGDTGLIKWMAKGFETKNPDISVRTEFAGALAVLDRGRAGNADLLITHHPGSELIFVGEGYGLLRTLIMYNDFAIFGPASDPLRLRDDRDPTDALRKMARRQVSFMVPGARSGTYKKLSELWMAAGVQPDWPGYEIVNSSSSATLRNAATFGTYAFADMGTYFVNREALGGRLVPLSRDNVALRNEYYAIVVSSKRIPTVNQPLAEAFLNYLVSSEGQERILHFGEDRFGTQIFTPAAHLDAGLQSREAAKELAEKEQNLERLAILAVLLALAGISSSFLFVRARRLEKTTRMSQERFALAVGGANDGIWDWDLRTDQGYFSARLNEIMGSAVVGETIPKPLQFWRTLIHPDDREITEARLKHYLEHDTEGLFECEFRGKTDNDKECWLLMRGKALRDEQGHAVRMSGSITDITDRRQQQANLEHQALHDALTGLPNRNLLRDRLHHAIQNAARQQKSVALILMDLDRFKEVNDTLGHQYGDLMLQQVSARLQQVLRHSDTIARLGGDEFALLISDTNETFAGHVAQKVHVALNRVFNLDNHFLHIGASLGIAMYPQHGDNAQSLIQHADTAMYVAKRSNSGCAVYHPEHDRDAVKRLELANELHDAIDANELELYYQPKIDLLTGKVTGVEALLRWQNATRGMVPPDEMIPIAEHNGMIKRLTLWVLNAALQQCAQWREQGIELSVAVNISVWNLQDPMLIEEIENKLAHWKVPANLLELEITESAMMADPLSSLAALIKLDSMGIALAVDDYGTGFSSLAYLKKLPVDIIKIDKSFVLSMDTDQDDAIIVKSTIELAHNLGFKVVAEGVESEAISDMLLALGCNTAQGYHYCRPINSVAFTRWLRDLPQSNVGRGTGIGMQLVH